MQLPTPEARRRGAETSRLRVAPGTFGIGVDFAKTKSFLANGIEILSIIQTIATISVVVFRYGILFSANRFHVDIPPTPP